MGPLIFLAGVGDRLGRGQRRSLILSIPLTFVQSVSFTAQEDEPVELRCQDAEVAQVGGERQVEGNAVERDAVVRAVHPVHEREESDATHEETQKHRAAIHLVQPALLQTQL